MSNKYVSPSALQHYDEKIKEIIEDKVSQASGNVTVDSALSSTSTNPVQNKVINDALNSKVSTTRKVNNKPLSSDITLSASDVGADASGSASQALTNAKTYTDGKIDAIVGEGASTTLDTIGEISKAIEEHQDVTDALNAAIGNKVDKVSGKGLSTNDLTSTLKSNYDTAYTHSQSSHAPSTAEKNVIVGIQKNGTDLTVNSSTRKVNVTVPTKTSELTNDSGFKTTDNNTTYSLSKSGSTITLTGSDGSTTSVTDSNTTYTHPTTSGNKHIPSGGSSGQILRWSSDGTAAWGADNNTTYGVVSTTADGLAPKRDGSTTKFLRADGTWATPPDNNTVYTHPTYTSKSSGLYKVTVDGTGHVSGTTAVAKSDITALGIPAQDTTYSNFVKSGSGAKAGLVPAPSTTAGTTKYLREDGTWATPPDTNTTYNLGSFGITATATELNYTDGVTSNIQTQLNNKISKDEVVIGTVKAASSTGAPVTTIGTSCNLSGDTVTVSPGGNLMVNYGITITDPTSDGSRTTINGHKIIHEGNLPAISSSNIAVPFDTELVFGTKNTVNRGFIKATSNSLLIKAPSSLTSSKPMESSNSSGADHGGAGLRFSYCSSGILPYSTLNTQSSMNLGSSSLKFGTIYSVASALNSDVKLKKDIESLSDESNKYLKTFDELDFVKFRWSQNMNGGLATPPSSRYHLGLIAQEVEQTFESNGIHGGDSGAIQANFFADNTSEAWISGGYQIPKEGYSYSENVWNYKHDLEYEWTNEIIEKDFSELNNTGAYNIRPNIQYIMFEDISKVAADGKQPPLKVNSITLVTKDDEYIELELTDNGISYYDHDNDTELTIPLSNATLNDDGSLFINFDKMWATYMLEVPTFAFADYKTLILDVDYIGEYKCYLIPEGEYKNANVWDRGNNDKILYDYTLNYNEIYALSLYALQETRKEYLEYKATTEATINELTEKVNLLLEKVGE